MKIRELLDSIRKQDLVLPEFQREYVWSKEQAKQLMVSLTRDYPVGSLLFWKTDAPPELKNIDDLPEKLGTIQVILDGQQRLTTLYLLIDGNIPPYYEEADIQTDPRELFFNIETGEYQYYQPSRMRGNPLWLRVTDIFNKEINVFQIAKGQANNGEDDSAFQLAQSYTDNLNKLRNIHVIDLPVQSVPPKAVLEEAIDIFDRVNSQGTKLTDAELALTHVTGKWSQARRVMKEKIEEVKKEYFYYDLNILTRCLTGVVTQHALFEFIHPASREQLEPGWENLSKILDYLTTILPQRAYIHSTQDLNTLNVLVPLVVYLSLNDNKFPNNNALRHATHWLYGAQTWSRYTSQTDQRLEFDVSVIVREPNPWDVLRKQIIDQRGRIVVKKDDLDGRWIQHPLYRMSYILAKAQGAIDWFNGAPLGKTFGKSYTIHNHHIFPQSKLYQNGYDQDNLIHRSKVNEIANRAFLTATTNQEISNRLPEDYFPEVEERYPGALSKQFIPIDPLLWKIENYEDFLDGRRLLIAKKYNEFMDSLVKEPEIVHERPIEDIIKLGESAILEFKSTLQWDVVQNKPNHALRKMVLKTIAALLNSAGGTLVIGVEDNGKVFGLENDLSTMQNSPDKYGQTLAHLISSKIGPNFAPFINSRFEEVERKPVCVVDVEAATEPAFLQGQRGSEFYIRVGPTTRMLDPEETMKYIENQWS